MCLFNVSMRIRSNSLYINSSFTGLELKVIHRFLFQAEDKDDIRMLQGLYC